MSAVQTSIKLAAVTALMLAAVVACGKKDAGAASAAGKPDQAEQAGQTSTTAASLASHASCNMLTQLGTCNEYRAEAAPRATGAGSAFGIEKSLCETFHGTFARSSCSTEGQIGSCLIGDGEVKRYYGTKVAGEHALSLAEAKSDCESDAMKGKFTVDPR